MNSISETPAFIKLFREAYFHCFGHKLIAQMTTEEGRFFSSEILRQTGLSIGWKSLKNYSISILAEDLSQINPSNATLDTLARYVKAVPKSSEAERDNNFIFWYQYLKEARVKNF